MREPPNQQKTPTDITMRTLAYVGMGVIVQKLYEGATVQISNKTIQPESIISKGVNMKDKEELEKLLVSGSEL